ncbi:glucosaminidase domain-containing protein [Cohnella faecalis]|uniref:Muramidase (Flagellum-specific) n=1 Tax=Cohnella faecalis TaxID=2315694 RepID=A0A398CFL0_9BACL|nr:glucosaminidase domain-containing protein [Cohnella faecalis]RIE01290.1 muramidase (flagellum-specific) [Cohnella faecalis]
MAKLSKSAFFAQLAPLAIRARREGSPLFPSTRLAQNLLETGCSINEHFNLGGFKIGSGKPNQWWKGRTYTTSTWEVVGGQRVQTTATWRSYDTVFDFYRDQDRLFQLARYARVRAARTPEEQCLALYQCGYATDAPANVDGDPAYYEKLIRIINENNLKKYDRTEEDEAMTDAEKKAFDALVARVAKLENRGPPPTWFVNEFGSADLGGVINDPRFTAEGWRTLAVAMRVKA